MRTTSRGGQLSNVCCGKKLGELGGTFGGSKVRGKGFGEGTYGGLELDAAREVSGLAALVDPVELDVQSFLAHLLRDHAWRKIIDELGREGGEEVDGSNIKNLGLTVDLRTRLVWALHSVWPSLTSCKG
jgi:hypothetical protein